MMCRKFLHRRTLQEVIPPWPLTLAFPRGSAVVHEYVVWVDDQAEPLGDLTADALLAVHARLVLVGRVGDAAVDRGRGAGFDVQPVRIPVLPHETQCMNEV